jgi:hypothetical protein
MKRWFLLFLLLPLLASSPECEHKFYVSNTLVELNARTQLLEITCKVFTDDFDRVLRLNGLSISLEKNTDFESKAAVSEYVQNHLKIDIDGRPLLLSFVGFESEMDLTYLYFESLPPSQFATLKVSNTLFFEALADQKNLVDIRLNGWSKSVFLTKEKPYELVYR